MKANVLPIEVHAIQSDRRSGADHLFPCDCQSSIDMGS